MNLFFTDICIINPLKKYLLFSLVFVYLVTIIGIPVYVHYCGGELETVNYMVRGESCCGEESEDEGCSAEEDCCKDENLVLKSSIDFTFKSFADHQLVKAVSESLFTNLFFTPCIYENVLSASRDFHHPPPPKLLQGKLVETSVIRI